MGMLSAALFFVISHAKPLEHLSADRPNTMIFSLYVFASICRSFALDARDDEISGVKSCTTRLTHLS